MPQSIEYLITQRDRALVMVRKASTPELRSKFRQVVVDYQEKLEIAFWGHVDGQKCGRRNGSNKICKGILELNDVENCSCHLGHAPCGPCEGVTIYCPTCGWDAIDDPIN